MSTVFWISYALLWALVVFSTLVLVGVVRTVYDKPSGVDAKAGPQDAVAGMTGSPAPEIAATDVRGEEVVTGPWTTRTALLFVSPDCLSCKVTLPELEALHHKVDGNVLVVCRSGATRCAQMAEEYGLNLRVVVDTDEEISRAFGVDIAPTAVLIAADGTIEASGHPMSGEELEQMVAANEQAAAELKVMAPGA